MEAFKNSHLGVLLGKVTSDIYQLLCLGKSIRSL